MGWASGSSVARPLIETIKEQVAEESVRLEIYKVLYDVLRDQDWDTVDEAMGIDPVFDQVAIEDGFTWE